MAPVVTMESGNVVATPVKVGSSVAVESGADGAEYAADRAVGEGDAGERAVGHTGQCAQGDRKDRPAFGIKQLKHCGGL